MTCTIIYWWYTYAAMWQDYIFSVAGIFFTIALLPSLFSVDKPAITTSIMNGCILIAIIATYISLSLWLSALITVSTCLIWFTLAWQKYLSLKEIAQE